MKERLDKLMVARNLAETRERARRLILAGQVLVDESVTDKPGSMVDEGATLRIRGEDLPYVSRGGLKLAHALETFPLTVAGRVALDVGASTGGFTDCLLQNGAAQVYAVDVGYGQLAWKLRQDPRVVCLERTHICRLDPALLDPRPDLAVIDASFISLEMVLPCTLTQLQRPSELVALVKPQFEVGRQGIGKGGVVRDPELHREAVAKVTACAEQSGCRVLAVCESPVRGPKGNREFLLHLRSDA